MCHTDTTQIRPRHRQNDHSDQQPEGDRVMSDPINAARRAKALTLNTPVSELERRQRLVNPVTPRQEHHHADYTPVDLSASPGQARRPSPPAVIKTDPWAAE